MLSSKLKWYTCETPFVPTTSCWVRVSVRDPTTTTLDGEVKGSKTTVPEGVTRILSSIILSTSCLTLGFLRGSTYKLHMEWGLLTSCTDSTRLSYLVKTRGTPINAEEVIAKLKFGVLIFLATGVLGFHFFLVWTILPLTFG